MYIINAPVYRFLCFGNNTSYPMYSAIRLSRILKNTLQNISKKTYPVLKNNFAEYQYSILFG